MDFLLLNQLLPLHQVRTKRKLNSFVIKLSNCWRQTWTDLLVLDIHFMTGTDDFFYQNYKVTHKLVILALKKRKSGPSRLDHIACPIF